MPSCGCSGGFAGSGSRRGRSSCATSSYAAGIGSSPNGYAGLCTERSSLPIGGEPDLARSGDMPDPAAAPRPVQPWPVAPPPDGPLSREGKDLLDDDRPAEAVDVLRRAVAAGEPGS